MDIIILMLFSLVYFKMNSVGLNAVNLTHLLAYLRNLDACEAI